MNTNQASNSGFKTIQFDGSNHESVMDFMDGHARSEGVSFLMGDTIYVSSNCGMITGGIGDYVAKSPDGEVFLCKQ